MIRSCSRFQNPSTAGTAAALCAAALCMTLPVQAGLTEALTGGKASVDMRLRYESVDQDNALKDADAITLRTRLGYMTGEFGGASAFVEMEDVTVVGDDDYNLPADSPKTHSVIADPDGTEVNQAFLKYAGLPATEIVYGRQRLILDNARFVGNVGWRQNEQTFDGVKLVNTGLPDTALTYAYIYNVNDIVGDEVDSKNHLLNAAYSGLPFGTITGYAYLLEFPDAPMTSNKTLGLRFDGSTDLGGFKLLYTAEYAGQSDYKDGDSAIDADYTLLELGGTVSGVTAKLGYEVLGGDTFSGFETPLATKHAFNGWTDQFLGTPTDGLQDRYVTVGGAIAGVKLLAVYHDFESDDTSADYGTEWGLLAVKKFSDNYSAGIKYGSYSAEDGAYVDTDKLWVWGELKF
jgi:hypothetical protein